MAKLRHLDTGIYHVRHTCGTAHALCGFEFPRRPIRLTLAEQQANQICVVCEEMQGSKCLICGHPIALQDVS